MNKHWFILGAGAIGGLWAMRLQAAGESVSLLGRASTNVSRTLVLKSGNQQHSATFDTLPLSSAPSIQRLLVCTKAQSTAQALTPWLPHLLPHAVVLLLQNGMGVDDWLLQQRPDLTLITGITTDGVFRPEPDTLVLAGLGDTWLGAAQAKHQQAAQCLTETLQRTGATTHFSADILRLRWQKLATNCAINALTALHRCRNGELLAMPEALATMQTVCEEVARVMNAEGMAVSGDQLYQTACEVARKTANNISSTHADIAAHRTSEIEFLNGYVVRKAQQLGLNAPSNAALLASILALHPTSSISH